MYLQYSRSSLSMFLIGLNAPGGNFFLIVTLLSIVHAFICDIKTAFVIRSGLDCYLLFFYLFNFGVNHFGWMHSLFASGGFLIFLVLSLLATSRLLLWVLLRPSIWRCIVGNNLYEIVPTIHAEHFKRFFFNTFQLDVLFLTSHSQLLRISVTGTVITEPLVFGETDNRLISLNTLIKNIPTFPYVKKLLSFKILTLVLFYRSIYCRANHLISLLFAIFFFIVIEVDIVKLIIIDLNGFSV